MSTQTEGKHTPGPWLSEPFADNLSVYIACEDGCKLRVAFVDSGYWFLRDEYGPTPDKRQSRANEIREANARLIAAAPDMYEALNRVRDDIDDETMPETVRIIEAALAKAEGQS